jgi:hypothetical protein
MSHGQAIRSVFGRSRVIHFMVSPEVGRSWKAAPVSPSPLTLGVQPRLHFDVMTRAEIPGEWVLLTYRLPREPSTPRSSVWRKLRRLGVAQLGDGLVALPADARTREQLEWIADEVREAAGTAGVWLAKPATVAQERELATAMAAARTIEYQALRADAETALRFDDPERLHALRRLRAELHRIRRRDFFPPPECDRAVSAIEQVAAETPTSSARKMPTPPSRGLR